MTGQQPPPGGWQPPPGQPPQWPPGPPPQPQPPPSSGRLVASIIGGGLLGAIAGAFTASLLWALLTGDRSSGGLVLTMLITTPISGLLGAFWGMRRARRPQRPRQPIDPGQYPNRVFRRDRVNGAA
jgi:hypothetical protein